jgi:hypothetical protein
MAAIEFDDSSHQKRARAERDAFLQSACDSVETCLGLVDVRESDQLTVYS